MPPLVTVILPVRNEAPFMDEVLRAVLAQDYPHGALEVIVADGQSDDGTRGIVKALAAQDNRLRLIENPQRITTAALNLAIRAARGELIMRVDGHGVVPPNYVRECVAWLLRMEASRSVGQQTPPLTLCSPSVPPSNFELQTSNFDTPPPELRPLTSDLCPPSSTSPLSPLTSHFSSCPSSLPSPLGGEGQGEVPPVGTASSPSPSTSPTSPLSPLTSHFSPCPSPLVVGGAWECVGRGCFGQAVALATSSPFGVGNAQYRTCRTVAVPIETDSVPFWVLRRDVFRQIGLFREEMLCHEDYELNHRLRRAGGKVLLLPWLRSKYYVRSTLSALARQYWRYGVWKGRFLRSHPESLKPRHLIPPLFIAALLFSVLVTLAPIGVEGWNKGAQRMGAVGQLSLGGLIGAYVGFLFLATVSISVSRGHKRGFADCPPSESAICHPQSTMDEPPQRPPPGESRPGTSSSSAFGVRGARCEEASSHSSFRALFCLLLSPFLLFPMLLATLHFCWGTGVWFGLVRGPVPGQPPKL